MTFNQASSFIQLGRNLINLFFQIVSAAVFLTGARDPIEFLIYRGFAVGILIFLVDVIAALMVKSPVRRMHDIPGRTNFWLDRGRAVIIVLGGSGSKRRPL